MGRPDIFDEIFALGPLKFVYTNATRTDVKLELNPYSWTKVRSLHLTYDIWTCPKCIRVSRLRVMK